METNLTLERNSKLRAAADKLMAAATEYYNTYRDHGLVGAVVWVKDSDGSMVILTRGEYRETLMRNIERVTREEETVFDFNGEAVGLVPAQGGDQ